MPRVALMLYITPSTDLPVAWLRVVNAADERVVSPGRLSLLLTLESLPGEIPVTGQIHWLEEGATFPFRSTQPLLEALSRLLDSEAEG